MLLDNFASAVLYLAVFLTAIVFAYLGQKKNRKIFCVLAILLPTLLAGFRFSTGTDTPAYRSLYEQIGTDSQQMIEWRLAESGLEPFIIHASVLGNWLQLPPSFLFLIFAAITTTFLFFTAIMFNKKYAWLFYGMVLLIVFPESLNMMRQLAANSVQTFALALIFYKQRLGSRAHVVPIVLLLALSLVLHTSSILLLPIFVLPFIIKRIHRRTLTLLLCLLIGGCVLLFPTLLNFVLELGILPERHYLTFMEMPGSLLNIKFFAAIIMAPILLAAYHRRGELRDKQYGLLLLLGTAYAAVGFYSGYLGRLAMFFWIFIVMAAGDLICQLAKKESHRIAICATAAVLYFVVYFCVLGFNAILPYDFGF